ncbi:MAG: citrate transporter [Clostridia bacterium]|nr:citrate transporter [Clostridia bacterium]
MNRFLTFVKSHAVVLIAWALAALSVVFVPIDKDYIDYFDFPTLACLFLTLLVVGAFSGIKTFEIVSRKIVLKLKNTRRLIIAVVAVTYFGSMILANDMALITFLPLGWLCLKKSGKTNYAAFTFIMQNVAANLGGMLTPFGNPQNLYLYSYYSISAGEFTLTMLPPFLLSLALIVSCCLFVKREPLTLTEEEEYKFNLPRTIIYSVLFAISVLAVFRIFPWQFALIGVAAAVLAMDFRAFGRVSYSLLLTFCAFFILSGNVARIDAVKSLMERLTAENTLLTGVLCSQIISNVPTAVLLSRFATDYRQLLVAVNIGGVGTPVASLASLITLGKYREVKPGETLKYLGLFSAINFSFLALLTALETFIFYAL